ncbi:MAG: GHKL domain-containing protein [Acetatifactor sp.]
MKEFITVFTEFLLFYFSAKHILGLSLIPRLSDFAALMIMYCLLGVLCVHDPVASWIIGQAFSMFYIGHLASSENTMNIFLLISFIYIMVSSIQLSIVIVLGFIPVPIDSFSVGLFGNLSTLGIISLLFLFLPGRKIKTLLWKSAFPVKVIFIDSYIILLTTVLFVKMFSSYVQSPEVISALLVILLILLIANTSVLYYDHKLARKDMELETYQKNLPIYQSLIDDIRASQHEYTNHIQSLQQLPMICPDYDSLASELSKYTKAYTRPLHAYPLLQLNMPLLSASMYNLYMKATEKEVSVYFDIPSIHLVSKASEYDLADFVSILLDNAIQAVAPQERIYTILSSDSEKTHFEVRNPFPRQITQNEFRLFLKKGYSTKAADKKQHGLGLYYLQKELPKYDGQLSADCICFEQQYWVVFSIDV